MTGPREAILLRHGYEVRYEERLRYRGSTDVVVCVARRAGVSYLAFPDPGHFARIQKVQEHIPHMARIAAVVEGIALFEEVHGQRL